MASTIDTLKNKLITLSQKDRSLLNFGASKHLYKLNPTLTETDINSFELKYQIRLPEEYRLFLQEAGNGGAGPYYGLECLFDSTYQDLDYKIKGEEIDPSKEFPFTKAWNIDYGDIESDEDFLKKENEYFDPKWANGLLRIANFGCGVSINIVVNGPAYGSIWYDDRCSDAGIYPDEYFGKETRIGFFEWYNLWLDSSLEKLNKHS